MNRLEKILLTSAVLITLAGGSIACNKKDYPITPTQPTPIVTPAPTQEPTPTLKPYTPTPEPTITPIITNSYDFAKSLGLEADYLKNVAFDSNSKNLVSYLASLPLQIRSIAERSGMLEDILTDKKVDAKETASFNKLIGSYQKEVETMQPWLSQLSENEVTAALALNLRNFREAEKNSMFYNLDSDAMPLLLPQALFTADGIKRMYAAEINDPAGWRSSPHKVYASTMVDNITNFPEIQKKALEVANDSNYVSSAGHPIEELLNAGYFQGEAVGSTDKGINAAEDINLLLKKGSPAAKATLRIYARNMSEGRKGSAPQIRCELTEIDLWSIGIPSYTVVLAGHDVPTIPLTLDDIALLKSISTDPLLILDIDSNYHLPLQWTRKSIVKKEWEEFSLYYGTKAIKLKVSELKNY